MSRRLRVPPRWWHFFLVPLSFGLCGCAGRQQLAEVPPGALVVVPNAREVRRTSEYDGAIHYVVDDPYPGEVTTGYINDMMHKAGWRLSATSILRLDHPDGGRTWWTYEKGADTKVYQWDAGWSNDGGDLVTYLLRYEVSPPNAVARQILVSVVYTKSATVKKLRDTLNMK